MKKGLLVNIPIFDGGLDGLLNDFEIFQILDEQEWADFLKSNGDKIDAVLTNGTKGLTIDEIELLPNLKLISCIGAGYESVDIGTANRRGIGISHGPGTNGTSVADHAFALLLSIVRRIVSYDAMVKCGGWKSAKDSCPSLTGKTLGILGLGRIGMQIASRAEGFNMEVHYHNRNRRKDVVYTYEQSVFELATASDFLIVVCPGGKETYHLVDGRTLDALGPEGYLVSVGRGSVVDSRALVSALHAGKISAAGLDVFEDEPNPPAHLLEAPNITFTPHIAGRSPEARSLIINLFQRNLKNFCSGLPLVTPIPESTVS